MTMSLEEKLAATRAASAGRIPPDRQAIMHRATEDLRRSGILDRIVPVGSPAPSFTLDNHDGRRVSSDDLLAGGPVVVSFFRGSW
jgi:cytochrome oxidase Cu insertion factor (SCO1/SenC/PrrC family)